MTHIQKTVEAQSLPEASVAHGTRLAEQILSGDVRADEAYYTALVCLAQVMMVLKDNGFEEQELKILCEEAKEFLAQAVDMPEDVTEMVPPAGTLLN